MWVDVAPTVLILLLTSIIFKVVLWILPWYVCSDESHCRVNIIFKFFSWRSYAFRLDCRYLHSYLQRICWSYYRSPVKLLANGINGTDKYAVQVLQVVLTLIYHLLRGGFGPPVVSETCVDCSYLDFLAWRSFSYLDWSRFDVFISAARHDKACIC